MSVEMINWKAIETAPKDKTFEAKVLVDGKVVPNAIYSKKTGKWRNRRFGNVIQPSHFAYLEGEAQEGTHE